MPSPSRFRNTRTKISKHHPRSHPHRLLQLHPAAGTGLARAGPRSASSRSIARRWNRKGCRGWPSGAALLWTKTTTTLWRFHHPRERRPSNRLGLCPGHRPRAPRRRFQAVSSSGLGRGDIHALPRISRSRRCFRKIGWSLPSLAHTSGMTNGFYQRSTSGGPSCCSWHMRQTNPRCVSITTDSRSPPLGIRDTGQDLEADDGSCHRREKCNPTRHRASGSASRP